MGDETQVLVRFTTRLPPELQVPATEVAVPASLKRYGLSQIINHLLALEPPRPFDFIIDGELLRKSLHLHLLERNISLELVIDVEYVPAVLPPEPRSALPQDDWITAVAAVGSGSTTLASGAADGVVRVWNSTGDCLLEFSAHRMGVNALASISAAATPQQEQQQPQQQQQQPPLLLSAGKDHAVRLWQVTGGTSSSKQQEQQRSRGSKATSSSAECVVAYTGHKEAVQAVAAAPDSSMCCSGGWDGQVLLWRTGQQILDEVAAGRTGLEDAENPAAAGNRKKRKTGSTANGTATAAAPLELEPAAVLPGHVHCVSAVAWPESGTVYSGGWDHSVRRYDVETRTNTDTYNGSKAIYAVAAADAAAGSSSDVVALAGADKVLRVWDTRSVKGEGLAVKAYNAHEGWISSVGWRPGSSYHIATGGHDGAVKLWDIRSPVPLGSLQQHKDKVLCVGWWGGGVLVSGGADCKLQLYDMP